MTIDVIRFDFERFLALCKAAFASPAKQVTPNALKEGFADFWAVYPRKTAKADAQRAWMKHQCYRHIEVILSSVQACKTTADWHKDSGKFIPHPSTWLNGRRWEDGQESEDATAGAR